MANIDVEYTLTVKIPDIFIQPDTPRDIAEKHIKEMARQRIVGWASGNVFDPEGKIFSDSIKLVTK
jgi:hypothetical protein